MATLELEASPPSVSVARRFVAARLMEWGAARQMETAVLLTSELTTNAVFHGQPPIVLTVRGGEGWLRVEVFDAEPSPPTQLDTAPLDDKGRGLILIDSLASRWGSDASADGRGKAVWFELEGTDAGRSARSARSRAAARTQRSPGRSDGRPGRGLG